MVAASGHNREDSAGSFGGSISRPIGVGFTERELRAINRATKFGSRSKFVRSLIGRQQLEQLIESTEREHLTRSAN